MATDQQLLPPGFEQWADLVRRETELKLEHIHILKELRDAQSINEPQHKQQIELLSRLVRLAEANYTTNQAIYVLLAQMCGVEVSEANKLRKEIEADALERNAKALAERIAVITGDGNVIGDASDTMVRKKSN